MPNHIKYPWDKWLGKQKTILVRGVDYDTMTHSMLVYIRSRAAKRGIRVILRADSIKGKDTITITVNTDKKKPKPK